MIGPVFGDIIHGLVQTVYDPHGHDQIQELEAPVLINGRLGELAQKRQGTSRMP